MSGALDREEGDYAAKDLVGEAADEVEDRIIAATAVRGLCCCFLLQLRLPQLIG
jgi:hypothetical protein